MIDQQSLTGIFSFSAHSGNGDEETNRSGLTDLNQFASPDGLAFDQLCGLWIQTDNGADEVEEYTNDQMLLRGSSISTTR